MELTEIFDGVAVLESAGTPPRAARGLCCDSRAARRGDLFFALPGARTDGRLYIRQALRKGAVGVVTQEPIQALRRGFPRLYCARVEDAPRALSRAAANFYGHPSRKIQTVGITGTNGKTTTSYFLERILASAGRKTGVFGTVNYRVGGKEIMAAPNTTPISLELQKTLALMARRGAKAAVMEVSSHALSLGRVADVEFDGAIFTNLHRDHLDFHKTVQAYFNAKALLFEQVASGAKKKRFVVLNADDPWSEKLRALVGARAAVRTYGFAPGADHRAEDLEATQSGTRFKWVFGRRRPVRLTMIGRHNVSNALAAAAAAVELGVPADRIVQGLESLQGVPGRLENVPNGQGIHVFIDYAHTDSALDMILKLVHELPHRKLYTVFGCGGDRDRTKRGPMGQAAVRWSDTAFVTSDNPRTEDPKRILSDIVKGIKATGMNNYEVLADRGEAIARAVSLAKPGDTVVIAGKGHETYQILKDRTIHFDDKQAAQKALAARPPSRYT